MNSDRARALHQVAGSGHDTAPQACKRSSSSTVKPTTPNLTGVLTNSADARRSDRVRLAEVPLRNRLADPTKPKRIVLHAKLGRVNAEREGGSRSVSMRAVDRQVPQGPWRLVERLCSDHAVMRVAIALLAAGCLTACQTWTESDPISRRTATSVSTTSVPVVTAATAPSTTIAPPPATAAAQTTPATTAVVAATTVAPGVAGLVGPDGLLNVVYYDDVMIVMPTATTNRSASGAVVSGDGSANLFPADLGAVAQTARVGDSLIIESSGHRLDRFSLVDRTWTRLAIELPATVQTHLVTVGDHAVLTSFVSGALGEIGDPRITVIAADGTVTAGTPPENPWALPVPRSLTVVSDTEIIVYGQDTAHLIDVGLRQPAAYNPALDRWRMLSNPAWSHCAKPCVWFSPHDGVFYEAAAWAGTASYVHTKFGATDVFALHDVHADRWQQVQRPPVEIESPWIEATPGRITVFSTLAAYQSRGYGKAAMLDVGSRTWATRTFGPAATESVDQRLCPVRLAEFVYVAACSGAAPFPPVRLDRSNAVFSEATAADVATASAQRSPRNTTDVLATIKV